MSNIIFEDFCKFGDNYHYAVEVIVEIVFRHIEGVTRYSVLIRKHEDEDTVIGEFPVKKGLIVGYHTQLGDVQSYPVSLNSNLLDKTIMQKRDYDGRYILYGKVVSNLNIHFFSQSSQKKFLSEIRRIQKM